MFRRIKASVRSRSFSDSPVIAILPLSLAVVPWGILTGALTIQIGLSPIQGQAMSLLVFAGAAQLSGMLLMSGGASLPALFGSTFVISSRHLLYSVVFRSYVADLSLVKRLLIGFVLTDEMFAVSEAETRRTGNFSARYAIVSGVAFYLVWNLATLVGIIAGDSIQNLETLGLDFAIAATFIAMTFGELKQKPIFATICCSAVLAVFLKPYFSDAYIVLAALPAMLLGYALSSDVEGERK